LFSCSVDWRFDALVLLNSLVYIFQIRVKEEMICSVCGCGESFNFGELSICMRYFSRTYGLKGVWSSKVLAKLLEGKKAFALFSGGKDSLCATLYTMETMQEFLEFFVAG